MCEQAALPTMSFFLLLTNLHHQSLLQRDMIDFGDGEDQEEGFEGQHKHMRRPGVLVHRFDVAALTSEQCKD